MSASEFDILITLFFSLSKSKSTRVSACVRFKESESKRVSEGKKRLSVVRAEFGIDKHTFSNNPYRSALFYSHNFVICVCARAYDDVTHGIHQRQPSIFSIRVPNTLSLSNVSYAQEVPRV